MGVLSLAIWTPIFFGAVLLALGRDDQARSVRWLALIGAVVSLVVTLPLYARFDTATAAMQFVEKGPWIERFNVNYHLGIDGISFWFVLLTAFINLVVIISAWEVITERVNQYMGAFLILSGSMIGVFCAQDGILFYTFFEATLIPMYLIIGIWGGPNKIYAAFKFFLYTLLDNKYYMDWFNENVLARGARLLGVGLWKGGDQAVIDGAMGNGRARIVAGVAGVVRGRHTG